MQLGIFTINKLNRTIITTAGILIIIVSGILYYNSHTRNTREEKKQILNAITNLKLTQVINWKNQRLGDAYVLSESPLFVNATHKWFINKSDSITKHLIIKRLLAFKKAFGYDNLFITDITGNVHISVDAGFFNPDHITLNFIRKAVEEKKILYTDFYYCHGHSEIHFDILAPLLNIKGTPFAVLVLRVDPYYEIYPLIQAWPTPSKSAETLLVRQDGDSVLFLNKLRHYNNSDLSFRLPLSNNELPAALAIRGYSGIIDGIDYRGEKVLSDIRKVNDTEWFIVTKIDKDEIYSDLYYRQILIIFFMISMFLAFIFGITYIYHYRETEFYKRMYLNEKEIKEKAEEFRTILYSIGDAVIITDNYGFIRNLNQQAEDLTGWSEADATGIPLEKVFVIVNENSFEKRENPVIKVLQVKTIINLSNDTLLITKTGEKIPIADSAAPIKDESGNITGVVLVFRDQSFEREAQQNLINSETRFRSALDNMLEGCQVISYDWHYLYCNDASIKCYRLEEPSLSEKKIHEIFPGFLNTEIFHDMEICMVERINMKKEYEFIFADRSAGYLELSIHPAPDGIFVLTLDISERKKIEKELLYKCTEIESIFANMINAFIIWESVFDEYGRFVSFRFGHFNEAYSKIAGLKLHEVHGKDVFEVWPETENSWVEIYGEVALTGKSRTFDMYHKPTNGFYHCNAYRPSSSVSHICVIFEDITERKINEEIIKKGLEEKETLIRELYHRTKNNMQVIYGILSLQAEASGNEQYKALIQDTNNRIMSMSLVHQMLYKSKNLTRVNLHDYITELATLLFKSFNINSDKIEVNLDLTPVIVKIETAIPCGLILNELISNVFKHAFPGEMKGYLAIDLDRDDENILVINVRDNGIGMTDGFDNYKLKSLGIQLITSITEQQLNGSVVFFSDEGFSCNIRFSELRTG